MDLPDTLTRRQSMVLAATDLLEEHGPEAISARSVTTAVGASSMAVYTEFGSMHDLVLAVVDHGFTLLENDFNAIPLSGDALLDLWHTTEVLRSFAKTHRHLYSVMFSAESIAGHERTQDELRQGLATLRYLHARCKDAVDAGCFTTHPRQATQQIWVTMHGFVMLELAGYVDADAKRAGTYNDAIAHAMAGLGAPNADAANAVKR
jgi:AcrR family transcriptional regulator